MALVGRAEGELPLSLQADLLSLSRASLYYQPRPPSAAEVQLKHRIDAHLHAVALLRCWQDRGASEARRGRDQSENGRAVDERDGHRGQLSWAESESAESPGGRVSLRDSRHITSAYPNHIWGIDSTSIRLHAGWMYVVAILDWYSRSVVRWELDHTLEVPFVLTAMQRALGQAVPLICTSDQGSHVTSPHYRQRLRDAQVQISMDGKGRALDTILTERFWRTAEG